MRLHRGPSPQGLRVAAQCRNYSGCSGLSGATVQVGPKLPVEEGPDELSGHQLVVGIGTPPVLSGIDVDAQAGDAEALALRWSFSAQETKQVQLRRIP